MQTKLEKLIGLVYKKWKAGAPRTQGEHPGEEALACFFEGRLGNEEQEKVIRHLLACDDCLEAFSLNLMMDSEVSQKLPPELIEAAKVMLVRSENVAVLEVILRLKDKFLEVVNTTGDILVGQELMPAPVLRSRQVKDFKDEVTILKDFDDIRVEVKIEAKSGKSFNLIVLARQKQSQKLLKDLRVALFKDDLELESYVTGSGSAIFENVLLGRYSVDISNIDKRMASIAIDIKI